MTLRMHVINMLFCVRHTPETYHVVFCGITMVGRRKVERTNVKWENVENTKLKNVDAKNLEEKNVRKQISKWKMVEKRFRKL